MCVGFLFFQFNGVNIEMHTVQKWFKQHEHIYNYQVVLNFMQECRTIEPLNYRAIGLSSRQTISSCRAIDTPYWLYKHTHLVKEDMSYPIYWEKVVFHLYNHEFLSLGSFVQNLVELVLEKRISECCPSSLAKGDGMFQQNLAQRIVGEEKKKREI